VTNPPAKIKKTLQTAVTTSRTVIKGQNVQSISILIRRQNTVKISALLDARIPMKFHSADNANKKVRYCSLIVIPTLFVETGK
jgi:hypothetical protein